MTLEIIFYTFIIGFIIGAISGFFAMSGMVDCPECDEEK